MTHHDYQSSRVRPPGGALLATLLAVVVSACAADAWRPDPRYEAFLDQVQNTCGTERIGSRSIGSDLIQDAYFLDVTSRFYNGEVTRNDYANSLAGSFGGAADAAGILCILAQVPNQASSPPPRMPGYK